MTCLWLVGWVSACINPDQTTHDQEDSNYTVALLLLLVYTKTSTKPDHQDLGKPFLLFYVFFYLS